MDEKKSPLLMIFIILIMPMTGIVLVIIGALLVNLFLLILALMMWMPFLVVVFGMFIMDVIPHKKKGRHA